MPSVSFNARLIFDYDFYKYVIKTNPRLMMKLMTINARAKGCKRRFNILPHSLFNKILTDYGLERALLRCSFSDLCIQEIDEQSEDDMERTIKYAIYLLEEEPNNSFILTSDSKVEEYKNNPHYEGVKNISVKGAGESIKIIEDYFNQCKRD